MRTRLLTAAGLCLLLSSLFSLPARAADDIVFGFSVAMSGPMAAYDDNSTKMAQVFIDDINAKGGLLGRKIKAVFADTKSDRAEGAKAGQEVLRQGADVVFGTCDYDYGAPALLQAQKAGKISIFLCAEDPKAGIIGIGPYSFTSSIAAQVQGAVGAEWGYAKKGWKTAYVLLDDSIEYDKSVCAGFDWMFPAKGGKIVGRDTFKNSDSSIASQISRLRSTMQSQKVDMVMLCTYLPGGGSATRQLRAAGIDLPIFNGSSLDGTYWLDAVPNLSNFYVPVQASIYGDDPRPEIAELIARYKAKFNEAPVTQYAFPIYSILQVWAKAVEKAGTVDAAKVVAVMNNAHDEPTVLGPRSFTSKLHIQDRAPYMVVEIGDKKGKVVDSWRISEAVPNDVLYRLKK
ncbi:branched-chain amino acid transport system substrate-binding protein [Enhydrobacter aerosaccus]|uniref:Branched-chain amino acid transport system substrate-binding protein n=1 Tax=Enhydrobacter aerosaccus TaxID=225324 RepID=A0A1T4JL12_9HYPH|nr:ABC transporter substrate-binding protein [Enhydrobacter aerosaccus]SJZ30818.1 branched-chain amino acid transport system substrate-binding protein [Enhydrobacter aerosaccus]